MSGVTPGSIRPGHRACDRFGNAGVVAALHDDFSAAAAGFVTTTGPRWLDEQLVPFTEDELAEVWATLKLDEGGAVLSPLSLLTAA